MTKGSRKKKLGNNKYGGKGVPLSKFIEPKRWFDDVKSLEDIKQAQISGVYLLEVKKCYRNPFYQICYLS
jgi:hypothetical protein